MFYWLLIIAGLFNCWALRALLDMPRGSKPGPQVIVPVGLAWIANIAMVTRLVTLGWPK
jgi:hypothetical protein